MLELLGPQASHALGFLPAQPADGGNRLLVAAVVAPECGRRLVHRERDGAAGTGAHVAAGGTLQVGREAAPIQEQDHLLATRSEEHTSELQSRLHLVCRLLLEKKKNNLR